MNGILLVKAARLFCVDLKRTAAVGTNMIEAALGLAGIDDVAPAALWAFDDFLEGHRGHRIILNPALSIQYMASSIVPTGDVASYVSSGRSYQRGP